MYVIIKLNYFDYVKLLWYIVLIIERQEGQVRSKANPTALSLY